MVTLNQVELIVLSTIVALKEQYDLQPIPLGIILSKSISGCRMLHNATNIESIADSDASKMIKDALTSLKDSKVVTFEIYQFDACLVMDGFMIEHYDPSEAVAKGNQATIDELKDLTLEALKSNGTLSPNSLSVNLQKGGNNFENEALHTACEQLEAEEEIRFDGKYFYINSDNYEAS